MILGCVYTPNDCFVLPSLKISAIKCNDCNKVHLWELSLNWLWWGGLIIWGDIQEI